MKITIYILVSLVIVSLIGCAVPVTREESTPLFYKLTSKNLNLIVIEKRPYVLSGYKSAEFEGIVRGGFGAPILVDRPSRPWGETFAEHISSIMKDGFSDSGVKVKVFESKEGESLEEAIDKIMNISNDKSIIVMINESDWDTGNCRFKCIYNYDFGIFIVDGSGIVIEKKRFIDKQENLPSEKHNALGMYSVIYKNTIEYFFRDADIKSALSN